MRFASLSRRSECNVSSMSSLLSSTSRMSISGKFMSDLLLRGRFLKCFVQRGECEVERSALVQFRLRPDTAPVFLHDALHRGQAYSGAFEVFGAVHALENAEQLSGILHVESHTVVADEDDREALLLLSSNLDHRPSAWPCELESIQQQVLENLFH